MASNAGKMINLRPAAGTAKQRASLANLNADYAEKFRIGDSSVEKKRFDKKVFLAKSPIVSRNKHKKTLTAKRDQIIRDGQ